MDNIVTLTHDGCGQFLFVGEDNEVMSTYRLVHDVFDQADANALVARFAKIVNEWVEV